MADENIYGSWNHYDSSIDQTLPYTSTRKTTTQQRSKKEVLAINPTDSDNMMHFYRRDPDGTWSSKPGMDPVEHNISSPITHPETRVFRQGKHDHYNIMAVYAIR